MKNIDFMSKRGIAAVGSVILFALSIGYIVFVGVEKSVDFEGGSKLTVAFKHDAVNISDLREVVGQYEESAVIVALTENPNLSEFTIKIKNPQENDKASDISPERRLNLDYAFSNLTGENKDIPGQIQEMETTELASRLAREDIYSLTGDDAVRKSTYDGLAGKLKSSDAATLKAMAQATEPDTPGNLARGLDQLFPALNRTTRDKLNAVLTSYNPLNRADDADYGDIARQVMTAREAAGDFFDNYDFMSSLKLGEGENLADLETFVKSTFTLGGYRIIAIENFSASIAAELMSKASNAVILALLGILFYISARFNRAFAIASVVALTHDVVIALGVFAVAGAELSSPVVAAFLTIVGYSLNDTIVVFDRIRDNLVGKKQPDMQELMNTSINQTLSRTVVTSLTTLFVVGVIYFFSNNETLQDFSFPLLIGIVVGTYSSIFIASPTLLWWHNKIKPVTL